MTRTLAGLTAWVLGGAALASLAQAQDPPPPPGGAQLPPGAQNAPPPPASPLPAGAQALTRGPIHEAFAEPIVYDPKPGPVIAKAPPGPIEEVPPDQKPEGNDVRWIPGYWGYDDERQDFLWISGIWREVPPGRQWVPGYWAQAEGGFSWVPGVWLPIDQADNLQYLPEPPASLEAGPNADPPAADAVWAPGSWVWLDGRYQWQPGYWVQPQANWSWVPAHYTSTPNGYLYANGYWDRPFDTRGQLFAPVAFSQPVYSQPGFRYQPSVGLLASGLLTSLFVRPSYGQYYFGDYYGSNYANSGIYPWYSYHQSRFGYDPLYSYYAANQRQGNPNWANQLRQSYIYRRDHEDARPPRTFAEMARGNPGRAAFAGIGDVSNVHNVSYARPFAQIVSSTGAGNPLRFGRVEQAQARGFVDQGQQLRQFGLDRSKREAAAVAGGGRPPGTPAEPRKLEMARSPIGAQHPGAGQPGEVAKREALRPAFPANQPGGAPAREGAPAARPSAPPHTPPAPPTIPRPQAAPQPTPNRPASRPDPHFEVEHNAQGYPQSIAGRPLPNAGPAPAARPAGPPPAARPAAPPPAARPAGPPPANPPAAPQPKGAQTKPAEKPAPNPRPGGEPGKPR